jgi:hypothetical protein
MSRDSSTRIVAEATAALSDWERQTTGQHKALVRDLVEKHAKAARSKWVWGVAAAIAATLGTGAAWWTWGAVTDKAKALITADLTEKVDTQNTANNEAHGVLTKDLGAVKLEVTAIKTTVADTAPMIEALFDMKTEPALDVKSVRTKVARKRAAIKAAQPKDNQP